MICYPTSYSLHQVSQFAWPWTIQKMRDDWGRASVEWHGPGSRGITSDFSLRNQSIKSGTAGRGGPVAGLLAEITLLLYTVATAFQYGK